MTKRKTGAGWWVLLTVLVAAILSPLLFYSFRRSRAFQEVKNQRAQLLSRGLPVDHETLRAFRYQSMPHELSMRWADILTELDSEVFFESGAKVPIVGYLEDEQDFVPGQPYPYHQVVDRYLHQHRNLIAELHSVTERSGPIWTKADAFEGEYFPVPRVVAIRAAERLLTLELQDAIRKSDSERAHHSLLAMLGVARTLDNEPVMVSQLVRIAILDMTISLIQMAVESNILEESQLGDLLAELRSVDDFGKTYRIMLAGERAYILPGFDDVQRWEEYGEEVPFGFRERPQGALVLLDYIGQLERVPTDNLTVFYRRAIAIEDDFMTSLADANWFHRHETALTERTAPGIGGVVTAMVRAMMFVRLAKLGLATRHFEKRHGRWPDTLAELMSDESVGDLGPVAPIGSNPFGYRIKEGVAELWGFDPTDPNDSTPPNPDVVDDDPWGTYAIWHWRLSH